MYNLQIKHFLHASYVYSELNIYTVNISYVVIYKKYYDSICACIATYMNIAMHVCVQVANSFCTHQKMFM